MNKKILFIGTSYLGAIKLGYDAFAPLHNSATFIGFDAPNLAANLEHGWDVTDGVLRFSDSISCFAADPSAEHDSTDKKSRNKTFPGTKRVCGMSIDLRNFSRIVFVDMFHRLKSPFVVNDQNFATLSGIPVSLELISKIQSNGFNGWMSLRNHHRYGNAPFVSAHPLLTAIREAADSAYIYLISAPRLPTGNIKIDAVYGDTPTARRSFDFVEQFYFSELAHIGIEYLPQPTEILDEDGCLTCARYSRGAHLIRAGFLDGHMNKEYGEAILTKYAEKILGS